MVSTQLKPQKGVVSNLASSLSKHHGYEKKTCFMHSNPSKTGYFCKGPILPKFFHGHTLSALLEWIILWYML
uniref:Putative ovule protein n=1 Tax=Solanum chacoense TaxID=4108 RepID=A0A0V0H2M3_SOLCH